MGAMQTLQKGASYPAVTESDIRAQSISFPSIAEQRRIVATLDDAFKEIAIAKAISEKKLATLDELKAVLLRQAYTEGFASTLKVSGSSH